MFAFRLGLGVGLGCVELGLLGLIEFGWVRLGRFGFNWVRGLGWVSRFG